ncbi:MAG: Gfo/Idh/MocA family oxidoreductase [Clostridia bacterium]|nr:Gfo/Idh/MocA family oxidoreductase [Clostridia bacterium]
MFKVAVIGCGRISNSKYFPSLSQIENVEIAYACDVILANAEKAKEDFPSIKKVVSDYKVCLNDPEVDAVCVCTPNSLHYTVTMDALRAGKHVFCEKPITINYPLSKEMAEEAEKQGKMLNIGVCNRHNKSVEMLREWVENGKFGNMYHVYCNFRCFRNIPGLGGAFTTKSKSGGGVLIDWGIHFLDLILYVLGGAKLKTVSANAYSEMAKDLKAYKYESMWAEETANFETGVNDVDDFISGYVRTDKANISFNGAWAQNVNKNEMYIDFLGDKGGARLDYGGKFTFWNGADLSEEKPEYDIPDMYEKELVEFIKSIESGVKDKNHIDYVLESMKLLDALYESAEKNKEITL